VSILNCELSLLELLLSLFGLICAMGTSLYAIRTMKQAQGKLTEMMPSLDDFVWEEDGKWLMDQRLGKLVDALGSRLALSLRQSIFQGQGVNAKLLKGLGKAVAKDQIAGNPILSIAEGFGFNAGAYLQKNPQLGTILASLFQGKGNSPGQDSGGLGGYG